MIDRKLRAAFLRVAYKLLDLEPIPSYVREFTDCNLRDWREIVYKITEHYAQRTAGGPDGREGKSWLEATVHARDLLSGLWANGPKNFSTDDLEVAAALQFLAEERKWPGWR